MPSNRLAVVEAAAAMVRTAGPTAVTTVAVARQVGIAQSAVYRHVRDVDELRALAIHRVVDELDAELRQLGARQDPDAPSPLTMRQLLEQVAVLLVERAASFALVDRWRFDDGLLGEGVRRILLRGRDQIAGLLERDWLATQQAPAAWTRSQQRLTEAHAQLLQDDVLAVGRLSRLGVVPGGRRGTVQLLCARVRAGRDAYSAMMDGSD